MGLHHSKEFFMDPEDHWLITRVPPFGWGWCTCFTMPSRLHTCTIHLEDVPRSRGCLPLQREGLCHHPSPYRWSTSIFDPLGSPWGCPCAPTPTWEHHKFLLGKQGTNSLSTMLGIYFFIITPIGNSLGFLKGPTTRYIDHYALLRSLFLCYWVIWWACHQKYCSHYFILGALLVQIRLFESLKDCINRSEMIHFHHQHLDWISTSYEIFSLFAGMIFGAFLDALWCLDFRYCLWSFSNAKLIDGYTLSLM